MTQQEYKTIVFKQPIQVNHEWKAVDAVINNKSDYMILVKLIGPTEEPENYYVRLDLGKCIFLDVEAMGMEETEKMNKNHQFMWNFARQVCNEIHEQTTLKTQRLIEILDTMGYSDEQIAEWLDTKILATNERPIDTIKKGECDILIDNLMCLATGNCSS